MVLWTVICASIVPIITALVGIRKTKQAKIVYKFSQELFDAEYPEDERQFIGGFDVDSLEFRNHYD